MSFWEALVSRVSGLRQRSSRMKDLDREVQLHLELEAEEHQQSGLSREESRHAARRAFGNTTVVREDVRELWSLTWLEGLGRDLRHAVRTLRKNPGFTTVAVLTLALGIGANTAIFTALDALMLRPLPFSHAEQLVRLYATKNSVPIGYGGGGPSPLDVRDYAQASHSFQKLVAYDTWRKNVSFGLSGGEPEQMRVGLVPADYFEVLDVQPLRGRLFAAEENQEGKKLCRGDQRACLEHAFRQGSGDPRPKNSHQRRSVHDRGRDAGRHPGVDGVSARRPGRALESFCI